MFFCEIPGMLLELDPLSYDVEFIRLFDYQVPFPPLGFKAAFCFIKTLSGRWWQG